MCITASEIQDVWNSRQQHHKGQHYVASNEVSIHEFVYTNTATDRLLGKKYTIHWLPTQEEIQDILLEQHQVPPFELIYKFINRFKTNIFESLNEYWLVLMMETIYQKTWNGESWIPILNKKSGE
jgi:hypothetical protein